MGFVKFYVFGGMRMCYMTRNTIKKILVEWNGFWIVYKKLIYMRKRDNKLILYILKLKSNAKKLRKENK